MNTATSKIDGYYLAFTPEELRKINDALIEDGYSADGAGLKAWILEGVEACTPEGAEKSGKETPNEFTERLQEYIRRNPDQLRRVLQGGELLWNVVWGRLGARPR